MKRKNKESAQIAATLQHRKELKANRRKEPTLRRTVGQRLVKPKLLIVCEGENTEPSYFNHFKLSTVKVVAIGEGYNTVSLVRRAVQLAKKEAYEQVWCVFDKDDFKANDFNSAIAKAQSTGFGVAYSNQAFEYWILSHLDDHQGGAMHRMNYNARINELLQPYKLTYDGLNSKRITLEMFEVLNERDEKTKKSRGVLAIERAKRNYARYDHANPAGEESSTTVFKLVEELLKYG